MSRCKATIRKDHKAKGHTWSKLTKEVNQKQVIIMEKDRKTGQDKEFSRSIEKDLITIGRECKCGIKHLNPRSHIQPTKEPLPVEIRHL